MLGACQKIFDVLFILQKNRFEGQKVALPAEVLPKNLRELDGGWCAPPKRFFVSRCSTGISREARAIGLETSGRERGCNIPLDGNSVGNCSLKDLCLADPSLGKHFPEAFSPPLQSPKSPA